jgi:hypothetical protein
MARMEKQRDKQAKRLERKLARQSGTGPDAEPDPEALDQPDADEQHTEE